MGGLEVFFCGVGLLQVQLSEAGEHVTASEVRVVVREMFCGELAGLLAVVEGVVEEIFFQVGLGER